MKKLQEEILPRIARYLMLHGSFTNNIGLLNGKTGIVLFFYHYSRYTGKKIYDAFAGELIDEIYKEIHLDTPCNFKDGLCGIAWGIEYLIRHQFVEANPDEVLEDLDKQIIERDVRRMTDYSLDTGLKGIACYVIERCKNRINKNFYIGQDYLLDLIEALTKAEDAGLLINDLKKIVNKETIINAYNPLFEKIDNIKYNAKSLFEKARPIGMDKNGYAGIGLQLMKINTQ
ncbi:hypothetical protein AGMMS4957_03820 [Bacteroidia bacterium]|nr:hypothetical protein AGMMS4957_03460 [Bacteroidia bacterium]GHT19476.1 hypothetical protein AGMMS4957_03820 [Bacteroidia bacterium]